MLCRNPFIKNGTAYGCGQCMPCRINRRREWTHRIMLEEQLWPESCFATLTYEDGHLPTCATGLPTLDPMHLRLWLGRLRDRIKPLRFRFYGVGEYGERTQRPHYHVALFNFPTCIRGRTIRDVRTGEPLWSKCCERCSLVGETWGFGAVDLGTLTTDSAQYLAGYVTKKMTAKDDFRLNGRFPEFSRMSRRPGIGVDMMHEVASTLMEFDLEEKLTDVPSALRHGTRVMPIGRHLRRKLRQFIGRDEKAPQATLDAMAEEMRPVREAAFDASQPLKEAVIRAADQAVRNMEARAKLKKKRDTL